VSFRSEESPDAPDAGTQGFVRYHTGDMTALLWTIQWNNPEQGENSSAADIQGSAADQFTSDHQIAPEKENAVATFALSGGEKPADFTPPVEADEPTLRLHDKSVDGWVEYLQQLLNDRGLGPLAVDGIFGNATHQAVIAFQTKFRDQAGGKLLVDGVVGNQTWAALREEDPRQPSTDGRQPHTYVEVGAEARWFTEDSAVFYRPQDDLLFLVAVNTGDQELHPNQFEATARLTFPSGETSVFTVPLFTDDGSPVPPGQTFFFGGHDLAQQVEPGTYEIEAYMPSELGGDQTTETFVIP
jgi:peptidoglycan hydrolase-like protein with peptidoglycan-binding domain